MIDNTQKERVLTVTIPAKSLKRWKKKRGTDNIFLFDFRGVRSGGGLQRSKKSYRGRKTAFKSAAHAQLLCDQYFLSCFKPLITKQGKLVTDEQGKVIYTQVKPFTISGLAYVLDMDMWTLQKYCNGIYDDFNEDDDEYLLSTVLKRAKRRIEAYNEERLYDKDGYNGARYNLDMNFNWRTEREKIEIEKMKFERWKAEQELELKKQILAVNDEDSSITVNIVRKNTED